jgi:hypothetical protein
VETSAIHAKLRFLAMKCRTYLFGAICAFALVGGSGAYGDVPPPPPVTWTLSGTLGDGGNFVGFFTQDTYDYLSGTYRFVAGGSIPSIVNFGAAINFDNANTVSLGTGPNSVSIGNTSGYSLDLHFSHDLLTPTPNSFTGTDNFQGSMVTVTGTALPTPSPMAGGGLAGLFATASALLWLTRRRASALAGAFAARSHAPVTADTA